MKVQAEQLFVAMPFDGRKQQLVLHSNRKLYTTAAMARSIVTRTKYGAFNGTGRVLLVEMDKLPIVGDQPGLLERFVYAEERALFWGCEMQRLDDLIHGREQLVLK